MNVQSSLHASSDRLAGGVAERVATVLNRHGVRLTIGGEPTFVPIDPEGDEWQHAAVGPIIPQPGDGGGPVSPSAVATLRRELATRLRVADCWRRFTEDLEPDEAGRWSTIGLSADPGVLEVNLPACHTWHEYDRWLRVVTDAAAACGFRPWRHPTPGFPEESGGGNHLLWGGPTPADNPFFSRPGWVASILRRRYRAVSADRCGGQRPSERDLLRQVLEWWQSGRVGRADRVSGHRFVAAAGVVQQRGPSVANARRFECVANKSFRERFQLRVVGRLLPLAIVPVRNPRQGPRPDVTTGGDTAWLAGLRHRRTRLHPSLHPGIPPQMPLVIEIASDADRQAFVLREDSPVFARYDGVACAPGPTCRPLAPGDITCDLRVAE